ncbi:MAG: SDR family NAD(P)-dependent oxidoreductase [Desulfobacteraceae bacterium]|nr:MAG: SDR family NAD(P)-dependent oxidoreductase [Desulfobacteraceae bacterium]
MYYHHGPCQGKLGFLFPGQGSQYPHMGKALLSMFPEAQSVLHACETEHAALNPGADPLSGSIFPLPQHVVDKKLAQEKLRHTDVAQPAIGAVSAAMLRILDRFKVKPDLSCGHSYGELSALLAAGVIDDVSFYRLSALRGLYMARAGQSSGDGGSMLAVSAPLARIEALINDHDLDLILANRNSYSQGVLSGATSEIDRARKICKQNKLRAVKLPVAAAFHSSLVADAAAPFREEFKSIRFNVPQHPVLSNMLGSVYPGDIEKIQDILGDQLKSPVKFIENIETMVSDGVNTFVEIGPKSVLTGLTRSILKEMPLTAHALAMDSGNGKSTGVDDLAKVLCSLASRGFDIDLTPWEDPAPKPESKKIRVSLTGANIKPAPPKDLPKPVDTTAQGNVPENERPGADTPMQEKPTASPLPGDLKAGDLKGGSEKQQILDRNTKGRDMTPPVSHKIPFTPAVTENQDTIRLIQKGFEAIQDLQAQTARAHEKFLETQAQASQTIQEMMAQTRSMHSGTPVFESGIPVNRAAPNRATAHIAESPVVPPEVELPKMAKDPVERVEDNQVQKEVLSESSGQVADGREQAKHMVFSIVSKLTGFPEEMLELSMDIESDLGIDSIKKVEIVSELEKQMPDTVSFTTEHMASLKTLEEICGTIQGAFNDTSASTAENPVQITPETRDSSVDRLKDEARGTGSQGDTRDNMALLITTVSELTGFPVEMIESEMDLESDLGIDSIKRVEILSKLEQSLPSEAVLSPDDMTRLKTIGQIAGYLDDQSRPAQAQAQQASGSANKSSEDTGSAMADTGEKKKGSPSDDSHDITGISEPGGDPVSGTGADLPAVQPPELLRQIPVMRSYPTEQVRFYNGARIDIDPGKKVYITSDGAGIARALRKAFRQEGFQAELFDLASGTIPSFKDAAGIVLVSQAFDPNTDASEYLARSFELCRKNGEQLESSGRDKGAFLCTVTFMGSMFGLDGSPVEGNPIYGGLAGLVKTAALEWKHVLCRALDMPHDAGLCREQAQAAVSLMMTQGAVEMGLNQETCNIPELEPQQVSSRMPRLSKADVVVITGGAKGVTSVCALELAKAFSPTIVLIGRSPEPGPEPEWLATLSDPSDIKKELLSREFTGKKVTPAILEQRFRALMSNREITQSLSQIKAAGANVRYVQADIRDQAQIDGVFNRIREEFENITAVIHGAGVLQDKLIVEKTPEQYTTVFDTKVKGLNALIHATRSDSLKYFILFSSVAARTGNMGQADYAMANEVLNKTARKMSDETSECRVVSINWGPWDGGMVDASLRSQFIKKGIGLIDIQAGAQQMLKEMGSAHPDIIEVVIGASLTPEKKKKLALSKVLDLAVSTDRLPVLSSHRIDEREVLPFALAMEFMAHGAVKNNPGLEFAGLDDMRLLKGTVLEGPGRDEQVLSVETGKCKPGIFGFEVHTRMTANDGGHPSAARTECLAILTERLQKSPPVSSAASLDLKPYPMDVDQAYEKILFHGPDLQAITRINGYSKKGIEVVSRCAPEPAVWMKTPYSSKWTVDPLILDAAFQAAILWCHGRTGHVCLPSFAANLRLYDGYHAPRSSVTISLAVNEQTDRHLKGYFTFLNDQGQVIASMTGFEAVIDPNLMEKFKSVRDRGAVFTRGQILAFAQGDPSKAFGEKYKVFDRDREIARLPRPPYFFMDRVIRTDATQWEMAPGGWIEAQYDVPRDAWYFSANYTDTIPFCILLEIALQPCGWLAAYAGSALHSDERLHFRNLGGRATIQKALTRYSGTLTMRARMTDVSMAGGMIIQEFDMEVLDQDGICYQGHTNFGFFSKQALANQVGIRNSVFDGYDLPAGQRDDTLAVTFKNTAPLSPADDTAAPHTGMPAKALRMIDRIDEISLTSGGNYGNGFIRASKEVDLSEWFFDAHFYQDPVCPGSLGIESFLQIMRYFGMKTWQLDPTAWTVEMAQGQSHEWTYRGQIVPANKQVHLNVHIKSIDPEIKSITADGNLCVDDLCIYEMKDFTIQMVRAHQDTGQPVSGQSQGFESR